MKRIFTILFAMLIGSFAYSQKVKEVSKYWTSFSKSVDIASDSLKKFKLVAYAKVITTDDKAWAGIWARVDNKPNQGRGFYDDMKNRPIKSDEWNSYTIEGVINSKSEKLAFGGICYYNGQFFFDKFELYIEDDNGEYQLVEIDNASFETKITDNSIPSWNPGISKGELIVIREFKSSSSEDSVDGNYSVLIEGKGISKSTGTFESTFPTGGVVIATVFILIALFSLMTYTSSTEDSKWSLTSRIGFRFAFIYFFLVIFFQNNGAYPFFEYVTSIPGELMQEITLWFGKQVIGIPYKINVGPNGSGDTTYDYLVIFIVFMLALLGTLIWSGLDRKRPNYKKLYYWLTTGMRYYVGLMLINYGLAKVIQLQFPAPGFYTLMETYGESSPMGLAWTFLGFSEGYNMFMGIAEVLAGLLLFRRTLTFGSVITLMTAMNVMAVNYFFDVPVKILSTHLVIMTLFLLLRDLRKVLEFLVTNRQVEKLTLIERPALKKGVDITLKIVKGLVLVYALGYGFYTSLGYSKLYGAKAPKPVMYGVYEVTNYVVNGDTITNYKSDKLWKYIRLERDGRAQIKKMNKESIYYNVEVDTVTQIIKFSNRNSDKFDFNYTKDGNTLDFNYINKNDTIVGQTIRLDQDDFLLTNRGFRWVSEYPFNR